MGHLIQAIVKPARAINKPNRVTIKKKPVSKKGMQVIDNSKLTGESDQSRAARNFYFFLHSTPIPPPRHTI